MDLRARVVELLAPLKPGDEFVPGARWLGVSTEVGIWLSFELRGAPVQVEVAPLGRGPFAAKTSRFAISYRCEGARNPIDSQVGLELCRTVAQRVAQNEERVVDLLAKAAKEAPADHKQRIREVRVESLLDPASRGAEQFYKLSPYVGCLIGCRYCYAQTPLHFLRSLEALPDVPWGSYVDARINAAEVLRLELDQMPPRPIKFCPILSDPYQAIEARYGLTRACLEAIRDAKEIWPTMVLTRGKLVTRDIDVFASLAVAWVGASIPTADDDVRRHFEPRAASIPERFAALTALRSAGARTFAVVQPILPGSIEVLADRLAETVSSVSIDVLRGEEHAGADFDDPRYAVSRTDAWQRARAVELAAALAARGVPTWPGELPAELLRVEA